MDEWLDGESIENLQLDSVENDNRPCSKRPDYLDWEEYFMATAFLAAKRSKDPKTQVGACIVNKYKRIVGIGYNGMPNGCNDDEFPWTKSYNDLESKFSYVCHAELNAVLNKNSSDVQGCTIYVVLFPCNECAKVIIQSGIKQVIYMSDKNAHKPKTMAAKRMLEAAGVIYKRFETKRQRIVIDFSDLGESMNTFEDNYIDLAKKSAYSEKRSDANL